ncbi:MAG: TAT-variant-translocated molybdopterin oxidoreductase [Bacteroidia bacterium]|nr:TAT-variant-translocated molybdopterin oxidoreductase [Bacteroidia bacterium]MCO5253077.1 TAT-variant-translocated molybdopterin oxidoreductase [Bacteroidota bacterium]
MSNKTQYWKGEEELLNTPEFQADLKKEFSEDLPLDEVLSENNFELSSNRRDFLKFFGFSITAVALAACNKAPIRKAIPYLVKPEDVTPGVANYYNSTLGATSEGYGVQVKVREGRPIKVDGNPNSFSGSGLSALGQASILSLYDTARLTSPMKGGKATDWATVDGEIGKALSASKKIAIVSGTIHSPSSLSVIKKFSEKYGTDHITYDAISYSGILKANADGFGKAVIPSYDFAKSKIIVSFAADFLGTWISPVEFTGSYTRGRKPGSMSRHYQFESNLSLSGTNADIRFPMKQSSEALYIATLYNKIADKKGTAKIPITRNLNLAGNVLDNVAKDLLENQGASIIISGSNDPYVQQMINGLNFLLGNYGNTIDLNNYSNQYKGLDNDFDQFLSNASNGAYDAVIFWDANPAYNYHKADNVKNALAKIKTKISFSSYMDETSEMVDYVCPDNHYLESWGDAEPKKGKLQMIQPTISPVFNTRQAEISLLTWSGLGEKPAKDPFAGKEVMAQKFDTSIYYTYLKNYWIANVAGVSNEEAFNKVLHDGVYNLPAVENTPVSYAAEFSSYGPIITKLAPEDNNAVDLILYQKVGIRDGKFCGNPWVQELPDPVSKVTWDNYVCLPKALAEKKKIADGDLVKVTFNGVTIDKFPVYIQPGQANNTISIALGYGRKGKAAEKGSYEIIGKNAYPFAAFLNGTRQWTVSGVQIEKVSGHYVLAQTQTHNTIEGRDLLREATQTEFNKNPYAGNDMQRPHLYELWSRQEYKRDDNPGHYWAMAIDLNACTGCGACVVACSIENNVPVVGRDEVRRRREMHWIRIDRYFAFKNVDHTDYSNDLFLKRDYQPDVVTKEKGIEALDRAEAKKKDGEYNYYENVSVMHQPIMCQHCDNAPCETVCPVLATTHSTEGLNQMTYNRCIGTKYCANNCPFKVRRFNWFRYNDNDKFDFFFNNDLGKMVINPDVTVRTRGVMEKCSMCVQRIQDGKLKAKRERRELMDQEIQTACQRSCPANAIVFGDLNDTNSEVSKVYRNERSYHLLEELNLQQGVKYLTKIRNI